MVKRVLEIMIPETELFDERTLEFITLKPVTLQLEHSLVSISKWESKWCKPFLGKNQKTTIETIDYIKCMTLNKQASDDVYGRLSDINLSDITDYINAPMTATTINSSGGSNRDIITSEVIYYWMVTLNIPFECQKWHLNRLLTLVSVCNAKNAPAKKMSKKEVMQRNLSLNEARKKAMKTSG